MIISVYVKGRKEPFRVFDGKYLGHTRPDGKKTDNWHYYEDVVGNVFHFRKSEMQAVVEEIEAHDKKE